MKTRHFARGFVGALSLIGAIGAVACSSEPLSPEEAAEIGETSQAIGLANLASHPTVGLHSPAYIRVDADNALIAGGVDSTGAVTDKVDNYFYDGNAATDAWTNKANGTLSAPRFQSQIALIPGSSKFAVVGGRSNAVGNPAVATVDIIDPYGAAAIVTKTMSVERAEQFSVVPCGSGSKLLIIGGKSAANAAVASLEVLTYDATTPANSTVTTLKNTNGTPATVTLSNGRFDFQAIPLSTTKILVAGGVNGAGTLLSSMEIINLTANCELDSTSATTPAAGDALPNARRLFGAAPISVTLNITGTSTTYEAIIATGEEAAGALPVTSYVYDEGADDWQTAPSSLNVSSGRVRAMFAPASSFGEFALVGGKDLTNATADTSAVVNKFTDGGSGSWANATMTTSLFRGFAAQIGGAGNYVAGLGTNHDVPNAATLALSTVE